MRCDLELSRVAWGHVNSRNWSPLFCEQGHPDLHGFASFLHCTLNHPTNSSFSKVIFIFPISTPGPPCYTFYDNMTKYVSRPYVMKSVNTYCIIAKPSNLVADNIFRQTFDPGYVPWFFFRLNCNAISHELRRPSSRLRPTTTYLATPTWPKVQMASEETPLLLSLKHDAVYCRFSNSKKRGLVIMVSWCGLIPCTCGLCVLESLLLIEDNLKCSCLEHLFPLSRRLQKT